MFDILKISKELEFTETDTIDLVNVMTKLIPQIDTTKKLITYWEENCFRADDFEEIIEQFDEVEDIKKIGNRIFVLGSKKLVVIGFGKVIDTTFEWCDECGQESEISINGGKCEHCGKFLLPCSMCDMDKVNCQNCKFKNGGVI